MDSYLQTLAYGLPALLLHLAALTVIYVAGITIYVKLTPHKELELVQNGNIAAATTFSALIIGLYLGYSYLGDCQPVFTAVFVSDDRFHL